MIPEIQNQRQLLDFYRLQTPITHPGRVASLYGDLPKDLAALCRVVQNAIIHMWWIREDTYGITLDQLREAGRDVIGEIGLSSIERRLQHFTNLLKAPLTVEREPCQRTIGNCRDYSLLLTSILRSRGTPARARTGTARYFFPDGSRFEDHWICEFWNEASSRWQQVDPQIDDVMQAALGTRIDFCDLPTDQFLTGWQCHQAVIEGDIAPERIGFGGDMIGRSYTRYKLFGDLAYVTGDEILPWAGWGIGSLAESPKPGDEKLEIRIIGLLKSIDQPAALQEARELMATHERLKRPEGYDPGPFQEAWLE